MRQKLTQDFVDTATVEPSGAERTVYWDTDRSAPRGFGLMVTAAGHRSFVCQYRTKEGTSRRFTFKDGLSLKEARNEAEAIIGRVAKEGDPVEELRQKKERERKEKEKDKTTLKAVAEEYLKREGKKLRTADQRKQILERLVYPSKIAAHQIETIKRSDIVRLLDKIEDENGGRMADMVLAILRKIMNWRASRTDDFNSPIVKGMARTKPKERARKRVLTDDELRAIWKAADHGPFGAFVRFLLLTGARRNEAAKITWSELDAADWTLPSARNGKTKLDLVRPLGSAAWALLKTVPNIDKCDFVFTSDGRRALGGFSKFKTGLDKLVLAELRKVATARNDRALLAYTDKVESLKQQIAKARGDRRKELQEELKAIWWRLHDLRRTARTLMSRAGVDSDHAERCLGHVIAGVRGVYDRHEFSDEKAHAFEALATLIDRIVNPQENVVPIRQQA